MNSLTIGTSEDTEQLLLLLVEEQRQANDSLAAVNTVFQLSRDVVNESRTIQSDLETTEADALLALQRTTQQYSTVLAISQVHLRVHSRCSVTCCPRR